MENTRSLRLWDCAYCTEESEELAPSMLPLDKLRHPSGIVPMPSGVFHLGGSSFDPSTFDRMNSHIRTPAASGISTPAVSDVPITSTYHYQSITTQDKGRYDRSVQLRVQRNSAYGDLREMEPLTAEQIRTPAVLKTEPVRQKAPSPRRAPGTLYKDVPTATPQVIIDATQTLAQEVIQSLSPRKTRSGAASARNDSLMKQPDSKPTGAASLGGLISSSISALWTTNEEPSVATQNLVEVTSAIQNAPPASVTASARKNAPVVYGGAYAASPFHIQRPNHIEINDFPSPSRTPYIPAATRRTRD